ncbi:16S rRNA (guanine(966)-N(2))-methyltransferase RsmD [Vineibacter terrae]|uniref:16S rRNA (Guanine(966)-N(2))-methyltransferase RsmD n=1 Tax=Vineibacter terrae TaxID=2586908 RepID=A0A5C8PHP1_9HYPH|nr:16S rRNA (guanine(966)-N(2))-methyltransferase RsmD [Vineibacter terrae]TXL72859.1 16S rRNA (guanine(966)-N(2))-methyltransferase RsmD [Vineibacter terrae]
MSRAKRAPEPVAPRIGAGKHRGRPLVVPPGVEVRPTASRARESLFNILMHADLNGDGTSPLPSARVLDAFAGCGALGIEALSRGAAHVTFMDSSSEAVRTVGENLRTLKEAASARVLRTDATQPQPAPRDGACTLAFLDPPYRSGLAPRALAALARVGWLAPGAVCVVEVGGKEDLEAVPGFTAFDQRRYGAAKIIFLRYEPSDPAP